MSKKADEERLFQSVSAWNVWRQKNYGYKPNLADAHLSGASLIGTNLTIANLSGAHLTRANLVGSNLTGANLKGAHLTGANLSDANLTGANLSGTDFSGAIITGITPSTLREELLSRGAVDTVEPIGSAPPIVLPSPTCLGDSTARWL